MPNVLAVIQVIEKLPIEAVNATRLSNPVLSLPFLARSSRATTMQVCSRASVKLGLVFCLTHHRAFALPLLRTDRIELAKAAVPSAQQPAAKIRGLPHSVLGSQARGILRSVF